MSILNNSNLITRHVSYWVDKVDGKWLLCHKGGIHTNYSGYFQIEWFRTALIIDLCRKVLGKNWQPSQIL